MESDTYRQSILKRIALLKQDRRYLIDLSWKIAYSSAFTSEDKLAHNLAIQYIDEAIKRLEADLAMEELLSGKL